MKLELLKLKKQNIPLIADIYREEFSKFPYNEPWTKKQGIEKIKFLNKYCEIYVISVDKEIVGFIAINSQFMYPGQIAFGEELAIKSDFQNKGIGTWTLRKIFSIYQQKGFSKFMGIGAKKGKAIRLYKKLNILPSKENVLIERRLK